MGSGKQEKHSVSKKHKRLPLGANRAKTKTKSTKSIETKSTKSIETKSTKFKNKNNQNNTTNVLQTVTASQNQQLSFFLDLYQSANGIQLSSLELDSIKDTCMLKLSQGPGPSILSLGEQMKIAFGTSWKEVLCEKQLLEGKIDPGNPALLIISLSAIRSLELLRELRPLTRECYAAKLFSKHMKIEDQVSFLKNRVNIASGTPSRIKKLIDMEVLGLSRLSMIVLDMHTDVKGYSLFTLPQVRDEFWDLYKSYFHPRLLEDDLRICLYGSIPVTSEAKKNVKDN